MRVPTVLLITVGILTGACATIPPEQAEKEAIMWDAARECEKRFATIRVQRIDSFGRLWVNLTTETTADWAPFQACYSEQVRERSRRGTGG